MNHEVQVRENCSSRPASWANSHSRSLIWSTSLAQSPREGIVVDLQWRGITTLASARKWHNDVSLYRFEGSRKHRQKDHLRWRLDRGRYQLTIQFNYLLPKSLYRGNSHQMWSIVHLATWQHQQESGEEGLKWWMVGGKSVPSSHQFKPLFLGHIAKGQFELE